MDGRHYYVINGRVDGVRLDSRVLEEQIQRAVERGYKQVKINAYGQHGIGGRLWGAATEPVFVRIEGHPGQRVGAMGCPNTRIEIMGPASDDTGWLNSGAEIVVHGHAGNGTANAMAQGKVMVGGNIGARGMTMTKENPRFFPPQLWVLGSAGDYFGEFMAGGIAVLCGYHPQKPGNVLGYRPFVGMVGGKAFFRGPHGGFSDIDAKLTPITDADWQWLEENLQVFLTRIGRTELTQELTDPTQWQLLTARTPQERAGRPKRSMASFHRDVWDAELGTGGLIGDLTDLDRSPLALITTGEMRRFVPVWENRKFLAPCEASCPTGVPIHERWRLIREGRVDEAVDLALAYTPFPAVICGYLCPNPCMQACSRQSAFMTPVDITELGKASIAARLPKLAPLSGKKIAVVGGGPAGISVAWQLRQKGLDAVVYDMSEALGGKIASAIPESRIPKEVVDAELSRIREVIPHVHLQQQVTRKDIEQLKADHDFVVIAAGARTPRTLPVPGKERAVPALSFLEAAKTGRAKVGRKVVIIGAGNVGCDVAAEAHRLGAEQITLIDIQEPASFGKERKAAEAAGAEFKWPVFTREITKGGVVLSDGKLLEADTVFFSIGDAPDLSFLPEEVATANGFVAVNELYQSSDPKIFAVGDAVRPGLLTDAVGAGRAAAAAIADILAGKRPEYSPKKTIDKERIKLEYFDPRVVVYEDLNQCSSQCSSCGACRDCGICAAICPQTAISRHETAPEEWEYVVDPDRCIGCGFCAGACPCGIWDLVENTPIG